MEWTASINSCHARLLCARLSNGTGRSFCNFWTWQLSTLTFCTQSSVAQNVKYGFASRSSVHLLQPTTVPKNYSRPRHPSCITKHRTCHVCRVNIISTLFLQQMPNRHQPGNASSAVNVDSVKRLGICAKRAHPNQHSVLCRASKTFTALQIFDCSVINCTVYIGLHSVYVQSDVFSLFCRALYRLVAKCIYGDILLDYSQCDAALVCGISCRPT